LFVGQLRKRTSTDHLLRGRLFHLPERQQRHISVGGGCGLKRPFELIENGTVFHGPLHISDGFGYTKERAKRNKIYLRCRARKCKARANLDVSTQEFFVRGTHSCDL
jgi:hypothetical protein